VSGAAPRRFRHRHLLGIEGLSREDVLQVLDTAEAFFEVSRRPVAKVPTLRGKTVINLFYESSTRTRTSFEIAGKRLSADVINVSVAQSSVSKGETLLDTARTLEAMRPDLVVLRHEASGAPAFLAGRIGAGVINAGDGQHEHPTQALLDAFTIRRARGRLEGLVVAICGDVLHSRVARSNALLLRLFGAEVRFVGPRTLLPTDVRAFGARVFDRLEPGLEGADVVMVLRIQRERLTGAHLPTLREYARTFGVGERTLRYAKDDALVMHPGPMNRGVEIAPEVADGPHSAVLDQVEAGVAVRMAVLYLLAGVGAGDVEAAASATGAR
jgi:aspartate carbamoyltransferase catalytic subunit